MVCLNILHILICVCIFVFCSFCMFVFSYLCIPRWGLISIFELCEHIYRGRTSSLYFQNLQNKHRDANKKFQNVTEKVIGWGYPPSPSPTFPYSGCQSGVNPVHRRRLVQEAIFFSLSPEEFYFPPTGDNRNCQMGGFGGKVAHFFFAWKLPNGNLEGKYFFFFFDQPHLGNLDNFIVAKMKKR